MKAASTQILDEIEARLGNITIANGYDFDINKITRGRMEPYKMDDLPAINLWISGDQLDSAAYDIELRRLDFGIELHSLERDDNVTDYASQAAANIIVALNRADANPQVADDVDVRLGGMVNEFLIEGVSPIVGVTNFSWCGVLLSGHATYSIQTGDFLTILD